MATSRRPVRGSKPNPRYTDPSDVETDLQVLQRFASDKYLLRQRVPEISKVELEGLTSRRLYNKIPCETQIYVPKDRLKQALNTNQPLRWMREGAKVVKIISEKKRTTPDYKDIEILLWQKHKWDHPRLVKFFDTDPQHCWITMSLVGANLEDILASMRLGKSITGEWEQLPELFAWNTLRDIMAGLAWLHCDADEDITGELNPYFDGSIALDITAAGIELTPSELADGYPRAKLVNFACAVEKPDGVDVRDWMPARLDLENTAAIIHELAHGRKYSNKLQRRADGTESFCDCLESPAVPALSFVKSVTAPVSRRLIRTLDSISYAGGPHRLTSAHVLANINSAPFTSATFIGHGPDPRVGPLPESLRHRIETAGFIMNEDIRMRIPALAREYGSERDPRETSPWTEDDPKLPRYNLRRRPQI